MWEVCKTNSVLVLYTTFVLHYFSECKSKLVNMVPEPRENSLWYLAFSVSSGTRILKGTSFTMQFLGIFQKDFSKGWIV